MANREYPMALRFPAALLAAEAGERLPLALLSPEQQQRLLADLQELVRIEVEFRAAQQAIARLDLYAATVAYQTLLAAELTKLLYGSEELEAFDEVRGEEYLETMHELRRWAYARVLGRLQGG